MAVVICVAHCNLFCFLQGGGGIVRKLSPEEQAEYDQFHQNQAKAGIVLS